MHHKAGYPGNDSMRENAKREFDGELKGFDSEIGMHGSFSAPSRTKMRLFKKGGHVSHEEKKRPAMHKKELKELGDIKNLIHKEHKSGRSSSHREQVKELNDVKHLIGKERKLNKGGFINGGSLTNLHIPKPTGFGKSHNSELHLTKGKEMKKGGHSHHRRHHEHERYNDGGHTMKVYKHGGHYSHGGHTNMYERAMVGETNSHAKPRGNYESMMRGEHCDEHAGHHHMDRHVHRHEVLPGLKHGGHAHHPRGKHAHFAAGGVGKIRHNQSTPSGKQMHGGASKMRVY